MFWRRLTDGPIPRIAVLVGVALAVVPTATSARTRDRDHDRMPDRWERAQGLARGSPRRTYGR